MKNIIKAILFIPLAFLALGVVSLIGKYLNSNQESSEFFSVAHADTPVFTFSIPTFTAGCFAGVGSCGGCCCGGCCGC